MPTDASLTADSGGAQRPRPVSLGFFGQVDCGPGGVVSLLKGLDAVKPLFQTSDLSDARAKTVRLKPDAVVTVCNGHDCDGMAFLREINRNWPIPVFVINARSSGEVARTALQNGARAVLPPPGRDVSAPEFGVRLVTAIWPALRPEQRMPALPGDVASADLTVVPPDVPIAVLVIGASTGGLRSLARVFDHLGDTIPPTVIVQHIKPGYLERTAARMDSYYRWDIDMARVGVPIRPNQIRFAPDGLHLRIRSDAGVPMVSLHGADPEDHFVPSCDHLFDSAADAFKASAVGVILTGMGKDGARGLVRMRHAGARCLGESEESCVVYGMPRAAMDAGAVDVELPAERIGQYLNQMFRGNLAASARPHQMRKHASG